MTPSLAFWEVQSVKAVKGSGAVGSGSGRVKGRALLSVVSTRLSKPTGCAAPGRALMDTGTCQCRPSGVTRAPSVGMFGSGEAVCVGAPQGYGNSVSFSQFCSKLQTALNNKVY